MQTNPTYGEDNSPTNVDIAMPYNMDVSGLTAVLFGEAPGRTLEGSVIEVDQDLALTSLYDAAAHSGAGAGWIHYIQDASENNFRALINQAKAGDLYSDLTTAVNFTAGSSYDKTSQVGATAIVPASGACLPFSDFAAPWNKYNSLQDLVVSYFAIKILGHPGALAAISNDSVLRAAASLAIETGFKQIYGVEEISHANASNLTNFESKTNVTGRTGLGAATLMTEDDCKDIIEQMMNVDPYRFEAHDKNKWQPLPWMSGDVIRFQLTLTNNKYSVKAGGQSSLVGAPPAANLLPGTSADVAVKYQLKFNITG